MKRTKIERAAPPPQLEAPETASASFRRFHAEHRQHLAFLRDTTSLAMEALVRGAATETPDDADAAANTRVATPAGSDGYAFLADNGRRMNKDLFERGVNNLLTYVEDILTVLLSTHTVALEACRKQFKKGAQLDAREVVRRLLRPAEDLNDHLAVVNGSTRADVRLWELCQSACAKTPLESPINYQLNRRPVILSPRRPVILSRRLPPHRERTSDRS